MGFDEMRKPKLYIELIEEWMSTLTLVKGNDYPKSMRLEGYVGEEKMVMSRETLKHVAKFDTKASNQYVYPHFIDFYDKPRELGGWNMMVEFLFEPGMGSTLWRKDLKIEAKFLLIFLQQNVIPRQGDKANV